MATKSDTGPKLARMKPKHVFTLDDGPPGIVSLIRDTGDFDRQYALKVVEREEDEPADPLAIARLRATFEAAEKLNHRALVAVHDLRLKKSLFRTVGAELLMEAIEGKSLDGLDVSKVEVGQWVQVFREVAAALAHMHRRKVLHGNLTPSKIMITRGGRVKLLGYGQSLAPPEASVGSKAYQAPERVKEGRPPTEAADVYSLGAVMYWCLTGRPVGAGKPADEAVGKRPAEGGGGDVEKISTPAALNPKVPVALNNLVVSCLQRQVAKRPPGAYEVQKALDEMAEAMGLDDEALAGLGADGGEG
jgi:serine/threonine-protein kinase